MTVLDAIPTALSVAEAAILTALNALAPVNSAHWDGRNPDTSDPFTRPNTGASRLVRRYIAQHQDGGGAPNPFIGARFWRGLVVVRVFADTWEGANTGMALANTAMLALNPPAGYSISAVTDRPIVLGRDTTPARALQYTVTVKKVAP